jgi:drug/metabolite transporter (DMT)-like permease
VQSKPQFIHFIFLFIGAICIGWSAIFVKLAGVSGITSAFYRVLIASVVLFPIWIFSKNKFPDKQSLLLISLGGFFFGMDLIFWNQSIFLSSAGFSTALANFAPVWVALGSTIFFKHQLNKYFWLGTIVSIIGVLLGIGWEKINHLEIGLGNGFALIASFFYACYLLTTGIARQKTDTLTFMTFATIACTITLFFSTLILDESFVVPQQSWLALLGLGLITHVAGWLTINYALGHIHSSIGSVLLLSQAILTSLFAIPVLHEYLTSSQIIGGLIVLIGILIVILKR